MGLSKQYNDFAEDFSKVHDIGENSNRDNRKIFYGELDFLKSGSRLLDLACGDGLDLLYYKTLGAEVYGIDASKELIKIAKDRLPDADIREGNFEKLPYEDNYFDIVLSKYAIQTSENLSPVFQEIARVLRSGGALVFLVTHPFRQYFEKKDERANYFEQKIVDAKILNNTIVVKEPSHIINEYLTESFLKDFDMRFYEEYWDAAAEQIGGRKYPGFFIIKAVKRNSK